MPGRLFPGATTTHHTMDNPAIVTVNGVPYAPVPEMKRLRPPEDAETLKRALDVRIAESDAGNNITVRGYLRALLAAVWSEQEGFSGKRPFGNSDWSGEVITPLIAAGFIPGEIEDGYGRAENPHEAEAYVGRLIQFALAD